MRTPHPTLTPQELAIMKEVWQLDKATVRDVYEALREKRTIAYTTVMTMMKILEDKGYLKKTQVDRAYVYRPARPRQQVVGAMVRDFVDRVFDGAAGGLLLHLARDGAMPGASRRKNASASSASCRTRRRRKGRRTDDCPTRSRTSSGGISRLRCWRIVAAVLLHLLKVSAPVIRHAFWRTVLVVCLALPVVQPWRSTADRRRRSRRIEAAVPAPSPGLAVQASFRRRASSAGAVSRRTCARTGFLSSAMVLGGGVAAAAGVAGPRHPSPAAASPRGRACRDRGGIRGARGAHRGRRRDPPRRAPGPAGHLRRAQACGAPSGLVLGAARRRSARRAGARVVARAPPRLGLGAPRGGRFGPRSGSTRRCGGSSPASSRRARKSSTS